MNFNHAPYISPYDPPEESGIRPPHAWYEEPTTETPHGNTYYPPASTYSTQPPLSMPIDHQLGYPAYPYYPESSGFQPVNSQVSTGHDPEAPFFDYQTYSLHLFSPRVPEPQTKLGDDQSSYSVAPQYHDPGSSGAYAYRSSTRANPFSSPRTSFGTENYDAYPFSRLGDYTPSQRSIPDQNIDTWLKDDVDGHEREVLPCWSYNSQPYGEQSSYTTNDHHAAYIHPSELQEPYGDSLQGAQSFDDGHVADQSNTHGDVPSPAIEYRRYGQRIDAPLRVHCINCTTPLPTFGIAANAAVKVMLPLLHWNSAC
ncbi:hypothetical protein DER46DRAFT_675814 [Fusarium sp. MPI-SDFR-AT-0072]|nr:hypothetical protein DER46DRAFT_675814 [Fusarium sp. MPI-SDFR-AT-0072]